MVWLHSYAGTTRAPPPLFPLILHCTLHEGEPEHCDCLQPGKSLYTTMRELVENSLDAAESAMTLPDIDVTMCVPRPSPPSSTAAAFPLAGAASCPACQRG